MAIAALKRGMVPPAKKRNYSELEQKLFGLNFQNPVGLAAGFDKNAEVPLAMLRQGFGFVEVGTCTPLAQDGNPKPRMFRIPEQKAVINRLGFNNQGAAVYVENLNAAMPKRGAGVIGANIGKNKLSEDAVADYVTMVKKVAGQCDYITVNISSPNTPNLRELQNSEELGGLVDAVLKARGECEVQPPLLVKIAPDMSEDQAKAIADLAMEKRVDGLIVSNTTIDRPESLPEAMRAAAGGLSGAPLFEKSTDILRVIAAHTKGELPLIGVGGVDSAETAYAKIKAGASLVQLYSALVYEGLGLIPRINDGLVKLLKADGFNHISQAVGVDAK